MLFCNRIFVLLAFLGWGCASTPTWKHELESRVQENRLQIMGRNWLTTKGLLVDESLGQMFSKEFPGENLLSQKQKVIYLVGVSSLGREPLSTKDHRFKMDSKECASVREITDATIIERQIPFAFPFNRAFVVGCDALGILQIETPVGSSVVWRP